MTLRKISASLLGGAFALALSTAASLAAGSFAGTWQVKDSAGKAFDITLMQDGKATATRQPNMTGTWKQNGDSAVISWNTGWTTVIGKKNGHYEHMAYRKGESPTGKPNNTSNAKKLS